jgi:hypothetical protein
MRHDDIILYEVPPSITSNLKYSACPSFQTAPSTVSLVTEAIYYVNAAGNINYCHVSGVPWRIITGSGLDDWIYWRLLCTLSLNRNQYSTIADVHNFQFTVAQALQFAVSTSRILATNLKTGTITSNRYEVFSSFLIQSPWTADSPELDQILEFYSYLSSLICCIHIPLFLTPWSSVLQTQVIWLGVGPHGNTDFTTAVEAC